MRGVGENCIMKSFITCTLPRMIKSKRMRWAGYVTRMGRRGMHIDDSLKKRAHYESKDLCGFITLRRTLERCDGMIWTGLSS
jgi:hypothetical protein